MVQIPSNIVIDASFSGLHWYYRSDHKWLLWHWCWARWKYQTFVTCWMNEYWLIIMAVRAHGHGGKKFTHADWQTWRNSNRSLLHSQKYLLEFLCKSSFRWSRSRRSSSGSHVYSSLQAGGSFDAVNTSPPSHLFHSFLLNITSSSLFPSPHPSFKEFLSPLLLLLDPSCLVFSAPHLVLMSHSSARSLSLSPLFFSTHPSPPFLPENSTSSSSFKVFPHLLSASHRV